MAITPISNTTLTEVFHNYWLKEPSKVYEEYMAKYKREEKSRIAAAYNAYLGGDFREVVNQLEEAQRFYQELSKQKMNQMPTPFLGALQDARQYSLQKFDTINPANYLELKPPQKPKSLVKAVEDMGLEYDANCDMFTDPRTGFKYSRKEIEIRGIGCIKTNLSWLDDQVNMVRKKAYGASSSFALRKV